jgi:pyridoxamine 5'-phosphate oxidase
VVGHAGPVRDLSTLREQYQAAGLHRADLADDPVTQFERWWDQWLATSPYDPAACLLATADAHGRPSARFVLCRGVDADGFVIYTNQQSRKARDLEANPQGSLTFGWLEVARQVRVEGPVSMVDDATADAYWATRPRGSQLGAWASDQSEVVANRAELDRHLDDIEARFGGAHGTEPIPRPPYWGGYRVGVRRAEFWQGRPDRLHDRFEYRPSSADPTGWQIDRLAP